MNRRKFLASAAALLIQQSNSHAANHLEPFEGPALCTFAAPVSTKTGGLEDNNCVSVPAFREHNFVRLPEGDISSWPFHRISRTNFDSNWATAEFIERSAQHRVVLSQLFRIETSVLECSPKRSMEAVPAWWPGARTPGIIAVPQSYFDIMEKNLRDDRATGGWRVAALFALAHEYAHIASFSYPSISEKLYEYPMCFNELVADYCASAYIEMLKIREGYTRIDAAAIVEFFDHMRGAQKTLLPDRIDWHGNTEMRISAVRAASRYVQEQSLQSGLSLFRSAVQYCTDAFDTPELREQFRCAGIVWSFKPLSHVHTWVLKEKTRLFENG